MNQILVVTFAWSLAFALFVIWRIMRCPHSWELVDKTQLPSKIEELCKHWNPKEMRLSDLLEYSKVCATIVVRCPKCGHCKIIKMSNED